LVSQRLYELLGLALGFVLVDYGFNFVAIGFPGARQATSQFLGANLLIAGSALVFVGLYYLLKPIVLRPSLAPPTTPGPNIGIELVVEDTPGPQVGLYKNLAYIGYFLTLVGLISAADLILQVLIPSYYNEGRWWIEILLVVFGVLSYTIFSSIGRIGAKEEAELVAQTQSPPISNEAPMSVPATPSYQEALEVNLEQFTRTPSGEYEHHLAENTYDMFKVEPEQLIVWRENRQAIRSLYLAGPYELKKSMLEDHVARAENLRIGNLSISVETVSKILELQQQTKE
jgi:hypothetical protein